ncbi:MAG: hemolysin family protein [Lachnospiraceae bacterium]
MNQQIIVQMMIQILLITCNAIFACAEIAVISIHDNRLTQLAEQGDKRAEKLKHLTSQPARFLATIQVAITLSGFLGSAFAADNFSDSLTGWMIGVGIPMSEKTLDTIAVIIITIVLSYFTLVFGELVPKRIAMKKAESLALAMSGMISLIAKLFAPIVWVLTTSTNGILRICSIDPNAEEEAVSEEEIRMMVEAGSKKGAIDPEEQKFIQNVFEFDDLSIGEFATHRKDITLLWMEESIEKWEEIIHKTRHSRYPVCGTSVDDVIGILNVKEYYRLKEKTRDTIMEYGVTTPYFVPEGIRADVLFRQMKQSHNHFAVVLDEYGGMEGIVTINDLLEQLVGEFEDEIITNKPKMGMVQLDDNSWKINGNLPLEETAKLLQIVLPIKEYETFSGFVFAAYGSIPSDGSCFVVETKELRIQVVKILEHQVEEAIIIKKNSL